MSPTAFLAFYFDDLSSIMMIMTKIIVATFYHFTSLEDPTSLRGPLLAKLSSHGVRGTILLAPEGINGTLSGSRMDIDAALNTLRAFPAFTPLEHKESYAEVMPFYRLKVRVKKEIVTMGVPDIDPLASVGTYVEPEDWNALIADPGTIVIDARNDFEVGVGTFEGAVNPGTSSFSDLPRWLNQHRAELEDKKVAMFCTGGIRCEKATSYLNKQGIKDVFHLKGGILKYLEKIPEAVSRWQGECFVFDYRVAVKHGLKLGDHELCHACRRPLNSADRSSSNFITGVSCDGCIDQRSDEQRARYASRQLQVELAEERGEPHVGKRYETVKKSTAFFNG